MSDTTCPFVDRYQGPPLSDRQLAEIFMIASLRGKPISDPEVHEEMRTGLESGASPASERHPCLKWSSERTGIRYEVGHDGVKRLIKWSTLEAMDDGQLDLFEAMDS